MAAPRSSWRLPYADWTEEEKERRRATKRRYRQRHHDRALASGRRYRHSAKGRRTQRAYVARNRERIYAQNAASRQRCGGGTGASGAEELPPLHTGNETLLQAREIAGAPWYGRWLYRPEREDAASEAVLALLEGRDPVVAARRWLADEARYHLTHVPLYPSFYGQKDWSD